MTSEKTLVLVDGSSLAFRSYYALLRAGMSTADGTPTGAVYGFFNALFDLIERRRPDLMAVCFDLEAPTFRHAEFEHYKANRTEMPDELAVQWPVIKRGIQLLHIPIYELEGYEADDVIGTVAKRAESQAMHVAILTGDQDAFQLLDKEIEVLMPGRDGIVNFGRQEVFAKLGIWPEQVPDYKGLCGDPSDNIPGVKGIGEKTAVPLLNQYGTVEGIYEHIDEIKGAAQQKLKAGKDSAFASKALATIRCDIPLTFDFESCAMTMPEVMPVVDFLREMEFNSILRKLPKVLAPFNNGVPPAIDEALLEPVKRKAGSGMSRAPAGQGTEPSAGVAVAVVPVSIAGPPEPVVVRTRDELNELLGELSRQAVISVDLETNSLNSLDAEIVGYAFAWSDQVRLIDGRPQIEEKNWAVRTAYVPVRHFGERQLDPELVACELAPLLSDGRIGKIAQNAKFEMNVLSLVDIRFGPLVFDPMLASYVVNPDQTHGLKDQAVRLLDYSMVRIEELIGQGRKQATMDTVPVARVAPYAADDARIALELMRHYNRCLDGDQRFLLYEMEVPLTAVLAKMEQTGVALDLPYLKGLSGDLGSDLVRLEEKIFELAGHRFNVSSTQQLQKVLFDELALPARVRTKSGFSTDAAVLESLRGEHPIIDKIVEYRQIAKLKSTYVDALPRQISPRDGRLHGEFNQTATSTGRLSSSNPNLQNIPIRTELGRSIRRAFVPADPSYSLIAADYSQIELRLLAHMSGDETLIDAFGKDQDVHARTAMEIFDVAPEAVTSDMRRIGKTINFSLIYQQGAESTGKDLQISTREAQAFIDKYFSRYPRVKTFMQETIEAARRNGWVKTLWGRRRYFQFLNSRNAQLRRADERAACNAPLQGSAADLMKLAMIRLDQELESRGLAGKLILQVHDELVLEVPEGEIEETRDVVTAAMTLGQPFRVPLKVDVGTGKTWMDV